MELIRTPFSPWRNQQWRTLLQQRGLRYTQVPDLTLAWLEDDQIIAAASQCGRFLQYICTQEGHEGQSLASRLVLTLREESLASLSGPLWISTAPQKADFFRSLGFLLIADTSAMALLCDQPLKLESRLRLDSEKDFEDRVLIFEMADEIPDSIEWLIDTEGCPETMRNQQILLLNPQGTVSVFVNNQFVRQTAFVCPWLPASFPDYYLSDSSVSESARNELAARVVLQLMRELRLTKLGVTASFRSSGACSSIFYKRLEMAVSRGKEENACDSRNR